MSTDITTCPDCAGPRIEPWLTGCIAAFDHHRGCTLARQELDTFDTDRARWHRFGTMVRHRPVTAAERRLLRASGADVPLRAVTFARVEWTNRDVRRRTWTDCDVVAVDALVRPA